MINIISVGSGSTGNSMIIGMDDLYILVDMGVCYSHLKEALFHNGLKSDDIKACFITHTHEDHVHGYPVMRKHMDVPVFGSVDTALIMGKDVMDLTFEDKIEIIDGFYVTMFNTSHDCKGSCGFVFEYRNMKIGYVTDLGIVTNVVRDTLTGSDLLVIESNHDLDMLRNGPYPKALKKRIESRYGHLSNDDCASLCYQMAKKGTRHFLLAHLSQENNRPDLALKTSEKILRGLDCDVKVLSPSTMSVMHYE